MNMNIPENWDEQFYLEQNSDVRSAVECGSLKSGYEHFINYGSSESRQYRFTLDNTAPLDWSNIDYLENNPDLRELFKNEGIGRDQIFDHWLRVGRFEGRKRVRDHLISKASADTTIPPAIVDEMYLQAQFEPSLFPSDYFSNEIVVTNLDWMKYKGQVLRWFIYQLNQLGTKNREKLKSDSGSEEFTTFVNSEFQPPLEKSVPYSHIFLAPWLKTGGADKAIILFANAVARQPNTKVLVITTEVTDSPWANRLDERVHFFDLGQRFGRPGEIPISLGFNEQRDLLVAYLLDHSPEKVHVINSHLGWFMLGKYGRVLSNVTDLYASLYCYDFTLEGEPVGYARYIRQVAPFLKGIISDNTKFPDELCEKFGIERSKFITTWHPVSLPENIRSFEVAPLSHNVLWASRLDRQKRPDLLTIIARLCPDLVFHVYGESVMGDACANEFLKEIQNLPNIRFHGGYNSLNEIKRIPYRAFLYTSQWDGLPNILLEFGLLGLPIVAATTGGISDLVTEETAFPVYEHENITEYIKALRKIAAEPNLALETCAKMVALIHERHEPLAFAKNLANHNYFALPSSEG